MHFFAQNQLLTHSCAVGSPEANFDEIVIIYDSEWIDKPKTEPKYE